MTIYWIQTQCILLSGEQVLTIFLCIKRVRLNWNFIVYDVQNTTYSSHGAPCPARDQFPWPNMRVKVHISVWIIPKYPKRHSWYKNVPLGYGDTFLPLLRVPQQSGTHVRMESKKWMKTGNLYCDIEIRLHLSALL